MIDARRPAKETFYPKDESHQFILILVERNSVVLKGTVLLNLFSFSMHMPREYGM